MIRVKTMKFDESSCFRTIKKLIWIFPPHDSITTGRNIFKPILLRLLSQTDSCVWILNSFNSVGIDPPDPRKCPGDPERQTATAAVYIWTISVLTPALCNDTRATLWFRKMLTSLNPQMSPWRDVKRGVLLNVITLTAQRDSCRDPPVHMGSCTSYVTCALLPSAQSLQNKTNQ